MENVRLLKKQIIDDKEFSREYLYLLVSEQIFNMREFFRNDESSYRIRKMFRDSSKVAHFFENEETAEIVIDDAFGMLEHSLSGIDDHYLRERIIRSVTRQFEERHWKKNKTISFDVISVLVFKAIADYHNKVIQEEMTFENKRVSIMSDLRGSLPQTFLSYAYYDKGITLALFMYFFLNGGFLYVNWMWSGVNPNSSITKKELDNELRESQQLLFLRTLNSEFDYYGGAQIRQWCSWEIGNFYTKNKEEKYYIDFYGKGKGSNDLLTSFKLFKGLKKGVMYQ